VLVSMKLVIGCGYSLATNVLRLGVCYFALQTFQVLDKFNRQNNSTKPPVSGWCGLITIIKWECLIVCG
jgi:hypothetical protein